MIHGQKLKGPPRMHEIRLVSRPGQIEVAETSSDSSTGKRLAIDVSRVLEMDFSCDRKFCALKNPHNSAERNGDISVILIEKFLSRPKNL